MTVCVDDVVNAAHRDSLPEEDALDYAIATMRAARVGIAFSISNTGHGLPLAHLRNYTGFKERMLERPAVRKVIEREQSATWRERVTEEEYLAEPQPE